MRAALAGHDQNRLQGSPVRIGSLRESRDQFPHTTILLGSAIYRVYDFG
jgi:hypothetical protein